MHERPFRAAKEPVQPLAPKDSFLPYGKKKISCQFYHPWSLVHRYTVAIGPGFHWDLRFSKPCGLHQQETMAPSGCK